MFTFRAEIFDAGPKSRLNAPILVRGVSTLLKRFATVIFLFIGAEPVPKSIMCNKSSVAFPAASNASKAVIFYQPFYLLKINVNPHISGGMLL